MNSLPAYPVLRTKVLGYLVNPKPLSASNPSGFANQGCEFLRRR